MKTDAYHICGSLDSYTQLLHRFYAPVEVTDEAIADNVLFDQYMSREQYQNMQSKQLLEVLSLLVLPTKCQQAMLQRLLCNPFSDPNIRLQPCQDACQFCLTKPNAVYAELPRVVIVVCDRH